MKTLIDKAIFVCGSSTALAKRLDIAPNVVSTLRKNGKISPNIAAELAEIVGEEAGVAAIEAMISRSVGKRREQVIHAILGNWLKLHRERTR